MALRMTSIGASILAFQMVCFAADNQTAAKVAASSGNAMCAALSAADFTKVGVPVTAANAPSPNQEKDSAYCTYASKTAKGIEFDIFFPAGANAEEAKNAERASMGDIGGKFENIQVAGADEAHTNVAAAKDSASIVVRKGVVVFDINIPPSANARQQLVTLAETVLSRLKP